MAKLILQGWFHEVGEPKTVGKNDFMVQQIVFIVPGYENRMQEIKRPDEPWIMQVSGKDRIDKLNLTEANHGQRATITVFVEGYSLEKTADKPGFMGYRVDLYEVQPFDKKA